MKQAGILIEMENSRVKDTSLGMITLAAGADMTLHALVLDVVNEDTRDRLAEHGIHTIVELALPDDPLIRLNPAVRARAAAFAVRQLNLDTILGLSSADGKDIIPRIAALLDAPLVMDCVDVNFETNIAKTSQYSGKVMADIALTGDLVIFGIRPNAMPPKPAPVKARTLAMDPLVSAPEISHCCPGMMERTAHRQPGGSGHHHRRGPGPEKQRQFFFDI
jgi:electron transfer flavoprotein alpha subunit